MADRTFFRALGPGLLFAGAAIGVSHLVQSTRAGAVFGLGLVAFVLLANLFKYPAFSFGPRYAAATGTSLLEGYRRQGVWALVVYALLTAGTMFTVQAAVTIVTAGLLKAAGGLEISAPMIALVLTIACAGVLALGGYRWLDRIMKVVVVVLTVSTVAATVLAIPKVDWGGATWFPSGESWNPETFFFIAALVGWMPSAIDISVWHSLWTLARRQDSGHAPTVREAMLDFNIGYLGTALLALCFLLLGAAVMHGSGATFQDSAARFAYQVIDLYRQTLGDWSAPLIAVCATTVMISTTLTVIDGFPRAIATLWDRFHRPEDPAAADVTPVNRRVYWFALALLGAGSVLLIFQFLTSLKSLVDLATRQIVATNLDADAVERQLFSSDLTASQ